MNLRVYSMYLSVTQQNSGTRAFSKNLRMGMRGKTNKQTVIQRRKGRVSFIINKWTFVTVEQEGETKMTAWTDFQN